MSKIGLQVAPPSSERQTPPCAAPRYTLFEFVGSTTMRQATAAFPAHSSTVSSSTSFHCWGIHTEPIAKELQVHNLEDGGVVVQYRCATPCPDLAEQLARIVRRYGTQVILAPYPEMRTRIALTAWTRLDAFDDFDEASIVRFIRAYRGIDHHRG